ncbi:MAG: hypothetical protein WC667_06080 [Sulfurimonas sp.]|jgi:hypothetical protein
MNNQTIKTDRYLETSDIEKHLESVEYIIMAAPAPEHFSDTPIHFTIFLNTDESLPKEIQKAVLDKFLKENGISTPKELMSQIMAVGFAQSSQETLMPMLLIKPQDISSIAHTAMFVMDFLADSDNFSEAKEKSLTGWSYSYI